MIPIDGEPQRIPYDWARVPCPKCGAQPDQRCRTLTTGRATDAHADREYEGWRAESDRRLSGVHL